jgi:hypothetical protein
VADGGLADWRTGKCLASQHIKMMKEYADVFAKLTAATSAYSFIFQ